MAQIAPVDPALVKALADPLRAAILVRIGQGKKAPTELQREFEEDGEFGEFKNLLASVSYGVDVLKDAGLLVLKSTRNVRGAVAHEYATTAACTPPLFDLAVRVYAFGKGQS